MHLNPAEAVKVHMDVASRLSVACHWGTFHLTDEPLNEPPLWLAQELSEQRIDPQSLLTFLAAEACHSAFPGAMETEDRPSPLAAELEAVESRG
jgi:hypothetical protein